MNNQDSTDLINNMNNVDNIINFLKDYLRTKIEKEKNRKILGEITCYYNEHVNKAYCTSLIEKSEREDYSDIIHDETQYGQVMIREIPNDKNSQVMVFLYPRLNMISRKLLFTAKNINSTLTFEIIVKKSFFNSMNIEYITFSNEFTNDKTYLTVNADPSLNIKYKKIYVNAKAPVLSYEKMENNYSVNFDVYPEHWEDIYINNLKWVTRWESGQMNIDDAKQIIKSLLEFYEPDDYDDPEKAFVKSIIHLLKDVIDSEQYQFDVKIENLSDN